MVGFNSVIITYYQVSLLLSPYFETNTWNRIVLKMSWFSVISNTIRLWSENYLIVFAPYDLKRINRSVDRRIYWVVLFGMNFGISWVNINELQKHVAFSDQYHFEQALTLKVLVLKLFISSLTVSSTQVIVWWVVIEQKWVISIYDIIASGAKRRKLIFFNMRYILQSKRRSWDSDMYLKISNSSAVDFRCGK